MLIFEERGKPENPEKNFLEHSREPATSVHLWWWVLESNPGHIGGRQALSPLSQFCSTHVMGQEKKSFGFNLVFIFNLVTQVPSYKSGTINTKTVFS